MNLILSNCQLTADPAIGDYIRFERKAGSSSRNGGAAKYHLYA